MKQITAILFLATVALAVAIAQAGPPERFEYNGKPGSCPGWPQAGCQYVTRSCHDNSECAKGEQCCLALCEVKCAKPRRKPGPPSK
ncbi:unnamed protein product [Allacma fusca]|uniref:WAP domain-containing protein n=1 Tax=Allacma fusca TaxID=39272 RepID=A0A8J2LEQ6_9HEXA|nr:unnamed protein product [Allacma fusca]